MFRISTQFSRLEIKNIWINYHLRTVSVKEEPYRVQSVSTVKTVSSTSACNQTRTQYSSDPILIVITIYHYRLLPITSIAIEYSWLFSIFVDYSSCAKYKQWDGTYLGKRKANKQEIKRGYVQEVGVNTECMLCNQRSVSVFLGHGTCLGYSIRLIYCEKWRIVVIMRRQVIIRSEQMLI